VDDAALTERICELLAAIPGWDYRNFPVYTAAETGIFYGAIGTAPDRAVGVRVYGGTDEAVTFRRVQLRIRGKANRRDGADKLAEPARVALMGVSRWRGISGIQRESFTSLGADSNGREERTDNYLITLDNLEAS
jgi:hypothetical protein